LFFIGCSDDDTVSGNADDINTLILDLGELPRGASNLKIDPIGTSTEETTEYENVPYLSNSQKYLISNKFDSGYLFASEQRDICFPGAILDAKQLTEGTIKGITGLARNDIEITLSTSGKTVTVPDLTNTTVTSGIAQLLESSTINPGSFEYSVVELHSLEQAFIESGIDSRLLTAEMRECFSRDEQPSKNSVVFIFKQPYYTINTSGFENPADLFDSSVSSEAVSAALSGNPPCIVSSVNYGRIILVKLTGETSMSNIRKDLERVGITGGSVAENANFTDEYFLNEYKIDAFEIGNSGEQSERIITGGTFDAVNSYLNESINISVANPGYPVSFKTNYLSSGEEVGLSNKAYYWERDWKVDEEQYTTFHFYPLFFTIQRAGSYYYDIYFTDKHDNILKDDNGNAARIAVTRDNRVYVGGSSQLKLKESLENFRVRKGISEELKIHIHLYAYTGGEEDIEAGQRIYSYVYPWDKIPGYEILFDLTGNDDYTAFLSFHLSVD
jgi:hypothetical protein